MKQKLTAILTLPILLTLPTSRGYAADDVNIVIKCTSLSCTSYITETYTHDWGEKQSSTAQCDNKDYGFCWLWEDVCLSNTSGHDNPGYCSKICAQNGYDVMVYDPNNNYAWSCACTKKDFTEWQQYSTRRMRKYTATYRPGAAGAGCTVTSTATNNYKCRPGYYGTAAAVKQSFFMFLSPDALLNKNHQTIWWSGG